MFVAATAFKKNLRGYNLWGRITLTALRPFTCRNILDKVHGVLLFKKVVVYVAKPSFVYHNSSSVEPLSENKVRDEKCSTGGYEISLNYELNFLKNRLYYIFHRD